MQVVAWQLLGIMGKSRDAERLCDTAGVARAALLSSNTPILKQELLMSLLRTLLVGGALALVSTSAAAQSYDMCGTVSDNFGSGCTTVVDSNGDTWLPDTLLTGYNVGDTVRLQGTIDTGCFNFCFSLTGCITGSTVSDCVQTVDFCGVVSDNFGSGCTTVVDSNGDTWLPDTLLTGYNVGDMVRVQGTVDTTCFNFCFSLTGCINGSTISDCVPDPVGTNHCNGDGGDQMGCTDCPCANNAAPGTIGGCVNSSGNSTRLDATGDTSVSLPSGDTTDLRFTASGAPGLAFGVLLSDSAVGPLNMANPCFGMMSGTQAGDRDGLRCIAGGSGQRHGGRSADGNGDTGLTNNGWGGEFAPPAGIAAAAGFAAGQTRFFQLNHREDAMLICMRGLNSSQAVEITFTP
jgi:hypothetical protein